MKKRSLKAGECHGCRSFPEQQCGGCYIVHIDQTLDAVDIKLLLGFTDERNVPSNFKHYFPPSVADSCLNAIETRGNALGICVTELNESIEKNLIHLPLIM